MSEKSAPGQLEQVQAFVNTWEEGVETLVAPADLAAWLRDHGLLIAAEEASNADLRRAIEVREALRDLLLGHAGAAAGAGAAAAVLDRAARRARVRLGFADDGQGALVADARGVDRALGRLLAIVHAAEADGTWSRLKACGDPTCRWAFYDRTKNQGGRWCSMAACGNRAKARAFRERHAS
jgi:predicted RNA-binding Zn ribbon-like protein